MDSFLFLGKKAWFLLGIFLQAYFTALTLKKKKGGGGEGGGELFLSPCFTLTCTSVPVFLAESFLCVSLFFFSDLVTSVSIT